MPDGSNIYAGVAGYFGKPDHTGKAGVFQRAAFSSGKGGGEWKHVLDGVVAYTVFVKPDDPEALAEALALLWADRGMAVRLGQQAFAGVRAHYTIQQAAARLLDVYQAKASGAVS